MLSPIFNLSNRMGHWSWDGPSGAPPPTVAGIEPAEGFAVGGQSVTITGTGFQDGATVSIGDPATAVVVVSDTEITCMTPAGSGEADVVVTNPDTKSGTLVGGFTFVNAPVLTSILPVSGFAVGGQAAILAGADFAVGATVFLGGSPATDVIVVSAIEITCVTPTHAAGAVDATIVNPDSQEDTLVGGFTFIAAPVTTSITPSSGDLEPTVVTDLAGTGFVDGATVTFGGDPATDVVVVSSIKITCVTPAHAAGAVDVVVTNPDTQSDTLVDGFTYIDPIVVADSFTGSDDDPLDGHDPEVGGPWVEISGTWIITGNQLHESVGGSAVAVVDAGIANVSMQATLVNGLTALADAGLVLRFQNASNYLLLVCNSMTNELLLWRQVAGGWDMVDSAPVVFGNGDVIRVDLDGSSIVAFVNEVSKLDMTVATFATETQFGFFNNAGSFDGVRWDDLSIAPP